jgi:hypothetical protein
MGPCPPTPTPPLQPHPPFPLTIYFPHYNGRMNEEVLDSWIHSLQLIFGPSLT